MSAESKSRCPATDADFFAIDEETRFHELLGNELVEKASPSGEHGAAQGRVMSRVGARYDRRPGGGGNEPGGWWFATEVEIRFGKNICRPDVVGWRRERVIDRPKGRVLETIPDWVCEVLSPDNARNDLVRKKHIYHEHKVGHYWIVDPDQAVLLVYRWVEDGYLEVLSAERGEIVRAEPFADFALPVGVLFGDDD